MMLDSGCWRRGRSHRRRGKLPRDDFTRLLSTSSSSNFFRLMDRDELLRFTRLSSGLCELGPPCPLGPGDWRLLDITLPPTVKLVALLGVFGMDILFEVLVFIVSVPIGEEFGLAPLDEAAAVADMLVLVFIGGVEADDFMTDTVGLALEAGPAHSGSDVSISSSDMLTTASGLIVAER